MPFLKITRKQLSIQARFCLHSSISAQNFPSISVTLKHFWVVKALLSRPAKKFLQALLTNNSFQWFAFNQKDGDFSPSFFMLEVYPAIFLLFINQINKTYFYI